MTPTVRKQTNVRIEDDILDGLQRVKERDGLPISEQVRRALRAWLDSRGVMKRSDRRRAVTRKRS